MDWFKTFLQATPEITLFICPVRVSLANLDDLDYLKIGHHLHTIFQGYWEEWRSGSGNGHRPAISGSGTPAEQRA